MKILISVMLCFSLSANADWDYLKQGDVAKYTGFLITPEREQDLRLMSKKLEINEAIIAKQAEVKKLDDATMDVLNQRVTLYSTENLRLGKEIVEARGDGFWNKFVYFALGAVATTAIVYGVHQATK